MFLIHPSQRDGHQDYPTSRPRPAAGVMLSLSSSFFFRHAITRQLQLDIASSSARLEIYGLLI
jgi:hypothetical protein